MNRMEAPYCSCSFRGATKSGAGIHSSIIAAVRWIPGSALTGCSGMTATPSLLRRVRAGALFLLTQLGREGLAEILGREHLADLDLRAGIERRALHPGDRLIERGRLDQPEAGDQ